MKGLKRIAMIAALFVVAVGCGKKVEVTLAFTEMFVPSGGGTAEVALTSNGDWSVNTNVDWIAISPLSGNGDGVLTITAAANEGTESRSGVITVTTKDKSVTLTVRQDIAFINLTPEEIECMYDGGTFEVALSSNCSWEIVSLPEWISCSVSNGENDATLVVTVDHLDGDLMSFRDANVLIGNEMVSANLHVVQHASEEPAIEVRPFSIEVGCEGGTQTVSVVSPDSWTAQTDLGWVSLDVVSGEGDANITVTIAANEGFVTRSGNVFFNTSEGSSAYLTIVQEALGVASIELQPDTIFISPEGGVGTITLTSNVPWTLTSESWVNLLQTSGTGDAQIGLYVDKNPNSEDRAAYINAKSNNQLLDQIVVFQPARIPYLETDVTQVSATAEGGVYTINISSNQAWMVNKGAAWLHYEPENGYGNGQLVVTVDALMSVHSRSAELHLNGLEDGSVLVITIYQRN